MKWILLLVAIFAISSVEVLSGTCNSSAPTRACESCSDDADCGGKSGEWSYCLATRDAACHAGWCVATSVNNTCLPCDTAVDCGGKAGEDYCRAVKDPHCQAGWCNHASSDNACGACDTDSDCGGTGGEGKYCWSDHDPVCNEQRGFCSHDAPTAEMRCKSCGSNVQCGGKKGANETYYCWANKDHKCKSVRYTSSVEVPSGTCNAKAPTRACESCSDDADCGGKAGEWSYCLATRDTACHAGWCVATSLNNTCLPCDTAVDCGAKAGEDYCRAVKDPHCQSGWCNHAASANACGSCDTDSDCGGTGGEGKYCWSDHDPVCNEQRGFCSHDAPTAEMRCKSCGSNVQCGGKKGANETYYCWANKDHKCASLQYTV